MAFRLQSAPRVARLPVLGSDDETLPQAQVRGNDGLLESHREPKPKERYPAQALFCQGSSKKPQQITIPEGQGVVCYPRCVRAVGEDYDLGVQSTSTQSTFDLKDTVDEALSWHLGS